MPNVKPVHVVQHGQVHTSVWKNEARDLSTYYTVTFNRSYSDNGTTKYTQAFGLYDLLNLVRGAIDAHSYIARLTLPREKRHEEEERASA